MKILHTADWHLGKSIEGRERQEEQIKVMDEICQIADEEQIDLVLIAGDIYQTVNPPAWAENLFYETIHRLSDYGKRGVIVISGNHDQPERIKAANPLADKQGIYLVGMPTDQLQPSIFTRDGQVIVKDAGIGWLQLNLPKKNESAMVSVLPYPSESRIKQLFTQSYDSKEIRKAYSEFIGKWYTAQESLFKKDTVNLAMSHLFVQGGSASDSEIEIQVGGAYTVEPNHLPSYVQYVALGHLHRPQAVKGTPSLTRYAGSPLAYSFSEANHKKSVTILDLKPGGTAEPYEIPLRSGNPLIAKDFVNGIIEFETWIEEDGKNPAWLDITLHVPHPLSMEEITRIRKMHDGIIHIRVLTPELEEALNTITTNSKDPAELFHKFYQFKVGAEPNREVVQLFLELFQQQEEEMGDEE